MGKSSSLTIVLDGITVQHAGELLFDSAITSQQRSECRETYIRCLEDFAFAVLFGSGFALSGALAQVGQESPGLLLTRTFTELFHRLDRPGQLKPHDLIKIPAFRTKLASDLECLDEALDRGRVYWEHWMIREAKSYLGNHESLFDANTPPDQFIFGIDPPYLIDRTLQDKIPKRFIDNLANVILSKQKPPHPVDAALREFVARNALTLMTIDWWYEKLLDKTFGQEGVRVPHIIRSLVRMTQLEHTDHELRDARTAVTRLALADALSFPVVSTRGDLLSHIQSLRDQWPYPQIRTLFIDLATEIDDAKQAKKASRIIAEIQQLSLATDTAVDKVQFDVEIFSWKMTLPGMESVVVTPLKVSAPITESIRNITDIFQPSKRALRHLARSSGLKAYYGKLARVFPELGLIAM
jgi:hypothetical protein